MTSSPNTIQEACIRGTRAFPDDVEVSKRHVEWGDREGQRKRDEEARECDSIPAGEAALAQAFVFFASVVPRQRLNINAVYAPIGLHEADWQTASVRLAASG